MEILCPVGHRTSSLCLSVYMVNVESDSILFKIEFYYHKYFQIN